MFLRGLDGTDQHVLELPVQLGWVGLGWVGLTGSAFGH
jgi:hypothetical protein